MPACPKCGTSIEAIGATGKGICPNCGIVELIRASAQINLGQPRFCQYCGNALTVKSSFCPGCGKPLTPEAGPPVVRASKGVTIERQTALLIFAFIFVITSYFLPWAQSDGRIYAGWEDVFPIGIPYAIGVALSGVSFLIPKRRMILNILAGVFVILGGLGYAGLLAIGGAFARIAGKSLAPAYGLWFGILSGLVLIVVGVLQRSTSETE